jgi:hypothetical protein
MQEQYCTAQVIFSSGPIYKGNLQEAVVFLTLHTDKIINLFS